MSALETLESLAARLKERGLTIACAESCTGGLLTSRLTDLDGSSTYLIGGVISYATEIKIGLLKVERRTIERFGVVSEETALEMARGVRRLLGTDIGLSTTGYAGPKGEEVGLVCIAISTADREVAKRFRFEGARSEIKARAVDAAIEFALENI